MRRFPLPPIQAPGALVVMEPYPGDPGCGMEEVRNRTHEALARHEPLHTVLRQLAQGAEDALPGVRVVVFHLVDGGLRAHSGSPLGDGLLAALDGLSPDGAAAAPWWPLRGEVARLGQGGGWAPFLPAAESAGIGQCWSDLLVTAAGEVVGTLTLFLPPEASALDGRCRKLDELKHLAALALEQHHLLEELYFLAQRDPLTGVWNRAQVCRLLGQLLADSSIPPAVIWLELTGFHRVHSILGSGISDALLREAAIRLRSSLGPEDQLARVGADDFVVILPDVAGEAEAVELAGRLQAQLSGLYETGGHSIQISATVGISFGDPAENQPDLALRQARMAMESAQRSSLGTLACFRPAMQSRSRERMILEDLLRNALPHGELFLHYQPQFSLRTGELAGCEALMRWRQPQVGLVSPATFIPVAEETGLIFPFGEWSLEEACRQCKLWFDSGHSLRIGVNVSPYQFQAGDLVRQVEATLATTGLPPELLELEITESAVLKDLAAAVDQMCRIQRLGVTFALDDFGTGQSSLAWLRDLPVQRLKIDRRFLQELDSGPRTPILQSIISLAHELHLTVIIEGIETEDQFQHIQALGCDEVQGFLRGKPMDAERFANLYLTPPPL
ncbi:MAG TPA: EAL domain-containing protein [Paludibaculum sp.]|jgi:diguanylate cyclase (GGDEF)-like protein